jgi:cytochrome c oxidase subunit 2
MQANQPGIYSGQCTEFCGLSHARMRMDAVALTSADFGTWVDHQLTDAAKPTDDAGLKGEDTFRAQCSRCHQVNGLMEENPDGTNSDKPVIAYPDLYVVSGNAPNLTHLMSRTTFAGATFDLLTPECRKKLYDAKPEDFGALYLKGVTPECFNEAELREWVRNAPAKKPMFSSEADKAKTGGKYRGMPNLNLTDNQIDEIIAYLIERK